MTGDRFRIAVVGGGPAGTTTALRLAGLGHDVTLVERQAFPREHVGEALSPGVGTQLEWLDLGADFLDRCGARRPAASAVKWAGEWQVRPVSRAAATVDRARFDTALLEAARRRGVTVMQPARAVLAGFEGEWRVRLESQGRLHMVVANLLIDATGRSGFHGRRRRRIGPRTVALQALWSGTGAGGARVAAGADHWIWASPIPGRGDRVMVFADASWLPRDRAGLERFYLDSVRSAGVCPSGGAEGPLGLCDASAYLDEALAGPRFLRVGEAAYAIDPLSSSGVEKAISTGLTAAVVANTILRRPDDAALARGFYEEEAARTVSRQSAWAESVYATSAFAAASSFWSERRGAAAVEPSLRRALPAGPLCLDPDVRFETVAVVKGPYVERQEALVHSRLERPIAFVGGREAVPLFRGLSGTATQIEARLRRGLSDAAAAALLARMAAAGLLVPAEAAKAA